MTGSRMLVALRVGAPPERAFDAFTREIGQWWRPNQLFRFTDRAGGRLAFEPEPPERLVEIGADGGRFEIGAVRVWDPPRRLVFGWRQATFAPGQSTEVAVHFEPVDTGTLVTVEHFGWEALPREHAARHGFPLDAFQHRHAEWWQALLRSLRAHVTGRAAPAEGRISPGLFDIMLIIGTWANSRIVVIFQRMDPGNRHDHGRGASPGRHGAADTAGPGWRAGAAGLMLDACRPAGSARCGRSARRPPRC